MASTWPLICGCAFELHIVELFSIVYNNCIWNAEATNDVGPDEVSVLASVTIASSSASAHLVK